MDNTVIWIAAWISVWDILRTILEWVIIGLAGMLIIERLMIFYYATRLQVQALQLEELVKPAPRKRTLFPVLPGEDKKPPQSTTYKPTPVS